MRTPATTTLRALAAMALTLVPLVLAHAGSSPSLPSLATTLVRAGGSAGLA